MQSRQMEVIQMTNCTCNQVAHKGKIIEALCLNPKCQESAPLCSKCSFNSHTQCRGEFLELEAIPMQLMGLRQLSLDIVVLQEQINKLFKELLGQIDQMLSPVTKYQNQPNFTNLNEIGSLLRKNIKQNLLQSIEGTKNQIRLLLANQSSILEIQQKQEIKQEKKQEQEQKKEDPEIWHNKGNSLQSQWKYNEAIDCYNKAISIDPNHLQSWFEKGNSLQFQRKYNEAIDCYNKAISIDPNHLDSWLYKGNSLQSQGKYNEAIDCYNKAISIDPNHLQSWYNKGKSLYSQDKYNEAIDCYNKAISIDPNHLDSWFQKGFSLENVGRLEESIKCFEECNKIRLSFGDKQINRIKKQLNEKKK